jgi:hypothetical protein
MVCVCYYATVPHTVSYPVLVYLILLTVLHPTHSVSYNLLRRRHNLLVVSLYLVTVSCVTSWTTLCIYCSHGLTGSHTLSLVCTRTHYDVVVRVYPPLTVYG